MIEHQTETEMDWPTLPYGYYWCHKSSTPDLWVAKYKRQIDPPEDVLITIEAIVMELPNRIYLGSLALPDRSPGADLVNKRKIYLLPTSNLSQLAQDLADLVAHIY